MASCGLQALQYSVRLNGLLVGFVFAVFASVLLHFFADVYAGSLVSRCLFLKHFRFPKRKMTATLFAQNCHSGGLVPPFSLGGPLDQ